MSVSVVVRSFIPSLTLSVEPLGISTNVKNPAFEYSELEAKSFMSVVLESTVTVVSTSAIPGAVVKGIASSFVAFMLSPLCDCTICSVVDTIMLSKDAFWVISFEAVVSPFVSVDIDVVESLCVMISRNLEILDVAEVLAVEDISTVLIVTDEVISTIMGVSDVVISRVTGMSVVVISGVLGIFVVIISGVLGISVVVISGVLGISVVVISGVLGISVVVISGVLGISVVVISGVLRISVVVISGVLGISVVVISGVVGRLEVVSCSIVVVGSILVVGIAVVVKQKSSHKSKGKKHLL